MLGHLDWNAYSSKLLDKSEIDSESAAKLKELKANQQKFCKDYETMGGPEMLELKRACTETNEKNGALPIEEK